MYLTCHLFYGINNFQSEDCCGGCHSEQEYGHDSGPQLFFNEEGNGNYIRESKTWGQFCCGFAEFFHAEDPEVVYIPKEAFQKMIKEHNG